MIYGGPLGAYLSGVYQPGSASNPRSSTYSSSAGLQHQPYSAYSSSTPSSATSAATNLRRSASSRRPNVGSSLPSSASYDRVLGSGGSGLSSIYSTPSVASKQLSPSSVTSNNSHSNIGGSSNNIYLTPQLGRRSYLSPSHDTPTGSSNSSSSYVPNASAGISRYRPSSFKGPTTIENGNDNVYGSGSRSTRMKPPPGSTRHHTSTSPQSYSSITSSNNSYSPGASLPPPIYTSTAKLSPSQHYSSTPTPSNISKSTFHSTTPPNSVGTSKVSLNLTNATCTDYKKLLEQEKENNNLLKSQIDKLQHEITENREAIHEMRRLRRRESENRRLDKKMADFEESEDVLKKLKEENEKLKAENDALDRAVDNLRSAN
jgi:cell division protein FtsB